MTVDQSITNLFGEMWNNGANTPLEFLVAVNCGGVVAAPSQQDGASLYADCRFWVKTGFFSLEFVMRTPRSDLRSCNYTSRKHPIPLFFSSVTSTSLHSRNKTQV